MLPFFAPQEGLIWITHLGQAEIWQWVRANEPKVYEKKKALASLCILMEILFPSACGT